MIPIVVKSLIMFSAPAPSALILSKKEDDHNAGEDEPGVYPIVPVWIGSNEAQQLSNALESKKGARPSTHDLFVDALTSLDAYITKAVIDDVSEKRFSAKLSLLQYGREIVLDARPSDAITLAVRQNAPIFMLEHVFEQASYPYIVQNQAKDEEEITLFREFISSLSPDDFKN